MVGCSSQVDFDHASMYFDLNMPVSPGFFRMDKGSKTDVKSMLR